MNYASSGGEGGIIIFYLYTLPLQISVVTWAIGSLIMSINVYYIVTSFIKVLLHSGLRLVAVVFAGIFGFSGMLVYIAAIGYLVIRKNKNVIKPLLSDGVEVGRRSSGTEAATLPREDIVSMQLPGGRLRSVDGC